jgi:hypothetical protein
MRSETDAPVRQNNPLLISTEISATRNLLGFDHYRRRLVDPRDLRQRQRDRIGTKIPSAIGARLKRHQKSPADFVIA